MIKFESILNKKIKKTAKIQNDKLRLEPPATMNAASGDMEGEINLLWEPVAGARTYIIQKSKGLNEPVRWKQEDVITKCSYTVSNLKKGALYWFRVAAVGSSGQGFWSMEVQKKAP